MYALTHITCVHDEHSQVIVHASIKVVVKGQLL